MHPGRAILVVVQHLGYVPAVRLEKYFRCLEHHFAAA